ncbi:MAG TPA: hypothetical protein VFM18_12875 [Methanosarcina sp.]|nr:hypothetical protein [Methanosarcina sp.]
MTNKPSTQQPTIEELQALLAKQAEEIERLKQEKEMRKKSKGDSIYDLIDTHLKVHDEAPDALLWFDLLVFLVEKIKSETTHKFSPEVFAEYKLDFDETLRVLGYLKNAKIFGATKNKSKNKYTYKDFPELDANTYIKYALQDTEVVVEPTLTADDF